MIGVSWPKGGFKRKMIGVIPAAKTAATRGMKITGEGWKKRVRSQITSAGLGQRVANTVRGAVYPKGSKVSLHPAATLAFKAPHIILAFNEGAVIKPTGGRRMLAIPTKECPRAGRGRKMKPDEAVSRFGQPQTFTTPAGVVLMAFFVVGAKNGKGYRKASTGRARKGRTGEWVPFYRLVSAARMPRKLDLAGATRAAGMELPGNIAASWPRETDNF